jgi:hypothetical protein
MNTVFRIACLLASLTCAVSSVWAYTAAVNKTDYQEIHIVPTPGTITIDGDLKDWDLSGAVEMCIDEASRSTVNLTCAYMYDQGAFYVGGHVKDPSPMINQHDFASDMSLTWDADCLQLRLLSNPAIKSKASLQSGGRMSAEDQKYVCHLDLWYSTRDQKPAFMIRYTLGFSGMLLNPPEVHGVYKKDPDGKGYNFEYRIPWKILRLDKPWKDGDAVQTQVEMNWGDPKGEKAIAHLTDVRVKDSGDLGYMGPSSWGLGIVHGTGHLKLAKKMTVQRAEGHIPITFKLTQATKVSLAVYDKDGHIVRTCIGAEPMEAGTQTYLWDGLDDYDRPVPAGKYGWKLLTQEGFEQKYVCDVGVSGNPPYQNAAGTGGWVGDYSWPLCVKINEDQVVLSTQRGEAATPTIATDLNGLKKWGAWWGVNRICALYKGMGYSIAGNMLSRFDAREGKVMPFADGRAANPMTVGDKPVGAGATAITMLDGTLAVVSSNALYLVDPVTAAVKETLPLEQGGPGAATGPKGELYIVAGGRIGRYDLKAKTFQPLTDSLADIGSLACDTAGNLYTCVQGKAMQVWKFSPAGKLLQKIGKEGGRPAAGKFDPAGMLNPVDVAVDRNGHIWVAEAYALPKRFSVWNQDGTLWKDFFGSHAYSSLAFVDPEKPEDFYVGGVRYRVDYNKGTWAVDRTLETINWEIPSSTAGGKPMHYNFSYGPCFATVDGRRFMLGTDVFHFHGIGLVEKVGDKLVPYLFMAEDARKTSWVDGNNDAQFQPEEVAKIPRYTYMDSHMNLYRTLAPYWAHQGGGQAWLEPPTPAVQPFPVVERVRFTGFNAKGAPTWAFDKPEIAATDTYGGAVANGNVSVDDQGRILLLYATGDIQRGQRAQSSGHRVVCYDGKGNKLWEYHNVHVAFAWTSDPYRPGFIVGAFTTVWSSTKRLWGVTGYYGQYFLIDKETGLFVAALGQDQRSVYTQDHTMVLTESFNGAMWNDPMTGKAYFTGGDADARVWELKGYEDYKIVDGNITVNTEQFARAEKNAEQDRLAQQSSLGMLKQLTIGKLTNAAADGNYREWNGVQPTTIMMADNRMAQGQIGYDDKCLWLRFQVADESPLRNQATDYRLLFKTGDALDIQVCTDTGKRTEGEQNRQEMRVGDARILVTRTKDDKMIATIIRYRTPDKDKPKQHEYVSPVWKETVDEVSELNDLPMHCKAEKDSYVVEVGVPWSVIGLTPKHGLTLKGDMGVIYGNEGGTKNAVRYLWSDKTPAVGVNNDVPTEMRMHPNDLGTWMLE